MELAKLFAQASKMLLLEFETSADFQHPGSMGTYREDALKSFLSKRLPQRYAIGGGHVLGPIVNESKELDCVIIDNNVCPALIMSESLQFFPIEGVLGTIEIKSKLSKDKLFEGLENIALLKTLVPRDTIEHHVGGHMKGLYSYDKRPMPFGIVFAYGLGNNSLDSLESNLREWEREHDPASGANAVVVLNQGIILHMMHDLQGAIRTEDINKTSNVVTFKHGANTLFEFYMLLMRLISTITLGQVNWDAYRKPARRIDGHLVKGGDGFVKTADGKAYAVNSAFVRKLLVWAVGATKISFISVLQRDIGQVPSGIRDRQVYYYNPEGLPGLQSLAPSSISRSGVMSVRSSIPHFQLFIDDEEFLIPQAYLSDSDLNPMDS